MFSIKSKRVVLFMVFCLFIFVITGCSASEETPAAPKEAEKDIMKEEAVKEESMVEEAMEEETMDEVLLTLEQLIKFDGTDGNPSYIAIEGIIYDVSDVPQWVGGMHMGFKAGQDVTDEVNGSPHGVAKLMGVKIVGKIK